MQLDINEYSLIRGDTYMAIINCGLSFGCFLTAIFGMNLDNTVTIQGVPGVFTAVTVGGISCIFIVVLFFIVYLSVLAK